MTEDSEIETRAWEDEPLPWRIKMRCRMLKARWDMFQLRLNRRDLPCGCVNSFGRRMLTDFDCREHGWAHLLDDDAEGGAVSGGTP